MVSEPVHFGSKSFAAFRERSEHWTCDWGEIGGPTAVRHRLDVRGTMDGRSADRSQVDLF